MSYIKNKMDTKKLYNYWIQNSEEKWKTAESLIKSKRYSDALFFCHLALEFDLKAKVVTKTKDFPPLTHNLSILASLAGLKPTAEQTNYLKEITTFNIKARYDDYKLSFYKKVTKEYAEKYFKVTKELRLWIKRD